MVHDAALACEELALRARQDVDAARRIQYVNPQGAALLGIDPAEAIGRFCGDVLRGQGIPSLGAGAETLLEALEKIEGMKVKLAVPSAGTAAQGKREIRERIEQDRSYTLSVVRHVVTSKAARIPLERVLHVASEMYDDFPHLQEHLRNIEDVWGEMES